MVIGTVQNESPRGPKRAVVDVEKLRDYCLNPAHPRGRHKERTFASTLRLLQEDAEWLRAQLLKAALRATQWKLKRTSTRAGISWTSIARYIKGVRPFAAAGSYGEPKTSLD